MKYSWFSNKGVIKIKDVLRNLERFLKKLRSLPCCQSEEATLSEGAPHSLSGKGFFISTGTEAASENWAFLPRPINKKDIENSLLFFEKCKVPFIWPLLPEQGEDSRSLLNASGLNEAGILCMMRRSADLPLSDTTDPKALTFKQVNSRESSSEWADAVWLGFGDDSPAPDSLKALAESLSIVKDVYLLAASMDSRIVGTSLLFLDTLSVGIYYFAVLPAYRRKGIAMSMMNEILNLAQYFKKQDILLQSTPAGKNFYLAAEFKPLSPLPLFSASEDVF